MAGNKAGKKNQSSSTYFCFYASPIMVLGGARYFVQRNTILSLTLPEKFGAKSQSLAGERAKELWFSFVTICYDFGQFKTLTVNIYCSRALCKENAFLLTKMRYSDSALFFCLLTADYFQVKFHRYWRYPHGSPLGPNPSLPALLDESHPGGAWG